MLYLPIHLPLMRDLPISLFLEAVKPQLSVKKLDGETHNSWFFSLLFPRSDVTKFLHYTSLDKDVKSSQLR